MVVCNDLFDEVIGRVKPLGDLHREVSVDKRVPYTSAGFEEDIIDDCDLVAQKLPCAGSYKVEIGILARDGPVRTCVLEVGCERQSLEVSCVPFGKPFVCQFFACHGRDRFVERCCSGKGWDRKNTGIHAVRNDSPCFRYKLTMKWRTAPMIGS